MSPHPLHFRDRVSLNTQAGQLDLLPSSLHWGGWRYVATTPDKGKDLILTSSLITKHLLFSNNRSVTYDTRNLPAFKSSLLHIKMSLFKSYFYHRNRDLLFMGVGQGGQDRVTEWVCGAFTTVPCFASVHFASSSVLCYF